MAEYENDPNAVQNNEESKECMYIVCFTYKYAVLNEDGFGKESYYQCFVAETDVPNEKVAKKGHLRACKIICSFRLSLIGMFLKSHNSKYSIL